MLIRAFCVVILTLTVSATAWAQPARSQPACPASQPDLTDVGRKNLKTLTDKIDDLAFTFSYVGEQAKPFYTVTLSVADFMLDEEQTFVRVVRIAPEQGKQIVALLAASGWLNVAEDIPRPDKANRPNGYLLRIGGYDRDRLMVGPLGFDGQTYRQLAAVRAAVDGEAAKAMDLLLGRISFLKPADDGNNVRIEVKEVGAILLNGQKVKDQADLRTRLNGLAKATPVTLAPSAGATWQDTLDTYNTVAACGFERISWVLGSAERGRQVIGIDESGYLINGRSYVSLKDAEAALSGMDKQTVLVLRGKRTTPTRKVADFMTLAARLGFRDVQFATPADELSDQLLTDSATP